MKDIRPFDFVAILIVIVIVVWVVSAASERNQEANYVHITAVQGETLYPLAENRHVVIAGPLGENIVEIEEGGVRFAEAPCRDQICVSAGTVSKFGDWIACLPNRIFLRITGQTSEHTLDAMAF